MRRRFKIIVFLLGIFYCCNVIYAAANDSMSNINTDAMRLSYVSTSSEIAISKEIENDETAKSMFNDLLHELKPYLTDLIDENISDTYSFTTSDTIEIIVFHPMKFLSALKDYVANSLKEIFAIAEENSEIITK